jgi:CRP-like cAMP-binding protein
MAVVDKLILKLERRDSVSDAEREILERTITRIDGFRPRDDIVVEGDLQTESRLLLDGIVVRYKALLDGRRQITALHIAGDFVDLHSFTLKKLDHNVAAITPARLAVVPHGALRTITETEPHLTRLLWLNTMIDAAIHREWVVSTGRRPAIAHVANLFCEMFVRSQVVGLAEGNRYPLPITQDDLADICGLTPVHVNRMLQELRGTGAVEWRSGTVTVRDWSALQQAADFDPAYLNLERIPR